MLVFSRTGSNRKHVGLQYIVVIIDHVIFSDLNLTVESAAFDVDRVPMTAGLYAITSDDILEGEEFSLTLDLRNKYTNERIEDITWRVIRDNKDLTCEPRCKKTGLRVSDQV